MAGPKIVDPSFQVPEDAKALFERMQRENKEQIDAFHAELRGDTTSLNLNGKRITNELSVREDLSTIAAIERGFDEYMADVEANNKCSVSEYRARYLVLHQLFEHSGYATKEEFIQARRQASSDYMEHFSPFHPMKILDDQDPNKVLVIIPPIQYSPNMVNGNGCNAIDHFAQFAGHDYPEVDQGAQNRLLEVALGAQHESVQKRKEQQAVNHFASLKVLEVFDPDHPALKKMTGKDNENEPEAQGKPEEKKDSAQVKGVTENASGDVVIGDLTDDDLF